MDLEAGQRRKLDKPLKQVLQTAGEEEQIRVLLQLDDGQKASTTPALQPKDFASRAEFRRAANEQRRQQLETATADTRKALDRLGVRVRGGKLGRTVVVDGTAGQIAKTVALPGVKKAMLDREIEMEKSDRSRVDPTNALTAVEGIGTALATRMSALGIESVQALADLSAAQGEALGKKLGVDPERIQGWIRAARDHTAVP